NSARATYCAMGISSTAASADISEHDTLQPACRGQARVAGSSEGCPRRKSSAIVHAWAMLRSSTQGARRGTHLRGFDLSDSLARRAHDPILSSFAAPNLSPFP